MLGSVIDNANVDALNVQFYNNFCSVSSSSFNFDQWADWAKTKSPNKDVKIFLGVPGSSSAAGSGFTPASQLQSVIEKLKSSDASVFGGVTVWGKPGCKSESILFLFTPNIYCFFRCLAILQL